MNKKEAKKIVNHIIDLRSLLLALSDEDKHCLLESGIFGDLKELQKKVYKLSYEYEAKQE